jgi:hypothetical protein
VPVQGPFRNRPPDVGGASPSEPADRVVRHCEGPRDGRQCFVCLAVQLPRAADRCCASAAWPTPATTRCVGADQGRHGSEAIGCPCASAKHLDRRGYFLVWRQAIIAGCSMIMVWLQTRFSASAASSGSSPWKGGELAVHAAADRVRGVVDRRLVMGDRGDL